MDRAPSCRLRRRQYHPLKKPPQCNAESPKRRHQSRAALTVKISRVGRQLVENVFVPKNSRYERGNAAINLSGTKSQLGG
jgi:hypothetical protein